MIGFIDYELLLSKRGLPPPSLAAMMAAYLKSKENVQIIVLNNLETIDNFEKVYFFSDLVIDKLPKEIFQYPNVEMYGLHLSPIPLCTEHMIPDTTYL